jgi:AhpD family alkylhydroperoxidase
MARIPYVDPETAPADVREALAAAPDLNIFRMVANAHTALGPFLRLGAALLADGELDAKLRELAIIRVARLSGAEYEWVQHAAIAKAVGATDEQVTAIERGDPEAACFDEVERLVLAFTTEVVHDVGASEETLAAAQQRFSPREIVELLLSIGFYMMVARVMETTALDLDEPVGMAVIGSIPDQRP